MYNYINKSHNLQSNFDSVLINVFDVNSGELLHKSINISKAGRLLNITLSSISHNLNKTKRTTYKNKKSGREYRFEIVK